jgi:hypothetical protein
MKYFKLAIFAAATLSISAQSYAQSDQAEGKRAEAEARMQSKVDERCGDDEKCQQRMKDKFSEKRNERSSGREDRGDRADRGDKSKKKNKNSREGRRQAMLEKRCGDDQDCLEKLKARKAKKHDGERGDRGDRGDRGERSEERANKMADRLNERCGDDEKCREKMAKRHDKKMQEKDVEQDN